MGGGSTESRDSSKFSLAIQEKVCVYTLYIYIVDFLHLTTCEISVGTYWKSLPVV